MVFEDAFKSEEGRDPSKGCVHYAGILGWFLRTPLKVRREWTWMRKSLESSQYYMRNN